MPVTFDFSPFAGGNIFLEDDGIRGNASGRLRHSTGSFATFDFAYPADLLTLLYKPGQVAFLNPFDPLTPADLTVGNLASAAQSPDAINVRKVETTGTVTMATTGRIAEWANDPDADIIAGSVALAAQTGVGTVANALETQAANLVAETDTGGINIRNFGDVIVGNVPADPTGLAVGTSGNIDLEVHGSITLTDALVGPSGATVSAGSTSGNVVLNAIGADSEISAVATNHNAVHAAAGNVNLTAGGNITLGNFGNTNNDVRADGNVTIDTGGRFRADSACDVVSDAFGNATGGDVTITAARGIFLAGDDFNNHAMIGAAGNGGGNVILNAGVGFFLSLSAPSPSVGVFATTGDVTANADKVAIFDQSAIVAAFGKITVRPQTAGRGMRLGSAADGVTHLELSDNELDRLFAPSLVLGGSSTGPISIVASISPDNANSVTIQSANDITIDPGVNVQTVGDLTLKAGDDITFLGLSSLSVGGVFTGFVDVGNDDPGEGGTAYVEDFFGQAVRFFGGNDSDTLMGGAVDDWLDGSMGADTMIGRLGDDTYVVDDAGDVTTEAAAQGIDTVRATVSHTLQANLDILTLLGSTDLDGTGNTIANTLNGNSGDNTLNGGAGADTLLGNAGNDTLLGGSHNDLLNGGAGNDTMNGGDQTDTVSYAGAAAAVTVALIAGAQATGGSGSDTLSNVENLSGSSHADTLTGDNAVNILTGFNGNDTLDGLGGNDTLLGEIGADTLVGGLGRDLMTGGSSADIFDFNAVNETGITGGTRDQIIDFVQGSDKVDLATIDANTVAAGNQAFAFIAAAAFSGVAGQLRSVATATTTIIYGDVNGDAAADFQIQLNTPWTLTAGDFTL